MVTPIPINRPLKKASSSLAFYPPCRHIRAELNFVRFPFFELASESLQPLRDEIEVQEPSIDWKGKPGLAYWRVARSLDHPLPGMLARRIHREVVERVLAARLLPIENPIHLGSSRDICATLGIHFSRRSAHAIHEAILTIFGTTIIAKDIHYLHGTIHRLRYEDDLKLYSQASIEWSETRDGEIADSIWIWLSLSYLANVNVGCVIPLDLEYLRLLEDPIASRLYELLRLWFSPALQSNGDTFEQRYSTVCAYLPLPPQPTLPETSAQLDAAHQLLFETGYLDCPPTWSTVSLSPVDWSITYTAGSRAKKEPPACPSPPLRLVSPSE